MACHPALTLSIAVILAAIGILSCVNGLEFHADRSELVDSERPWNKQYATYKENFPRWDDLIVVVDGEPGEVVVDNLARSIANELRQSGIAISAHAGFDLGQTGPKLFAIAPRDRFDAVLADLDKARGVLAAENANAALGILLSGLQSAPADGAVSELDRLEMFFEPYIAAAHGDDIDFSFLLPTASRWQPLASKNGQGRLRFVLVELAASSANVNDMGPALAQLRASIRQVVASSPAPDTPWGVTGITAIEADETTQSIRDSTLASVIAFVLITGLMLAAFRGVVVPLLAAGALLIGLAWSFGWLMVSVGHLQLLSIVFSVILLGLGVDFALLFVARLELVRDEHDSLPSATARVFRGIGPGMLTGAITTAAAFGATALTDFDGMAEMGVIAAGGIILCLVAVLSVFPASLAMTRRWKQIVRHRPGGEAAHFAHGRIDFVDSNPIATLIIAVLVVSVFGWLARDVEYDSDILNLQPPGLESVRWSNAIVREDAQSVWSGLIVVEPSQAREVAMRLNSTPGVSGLGGMGMLFPSDAVERAARIVELRERVHQPVSATPGMAGLIGKLQEIALGIGFFAPSIDDQQVLERLARGAQRLSQAVGAAGQMSDDEQLAAWSALNNAFGEAQRELSSWLDEALSPEAPGAQALPELLRELWVGRDGAWLMRVHPETDASGVSILDARRLKPFVEAMRGALIGMSIDPIGPPVQIFESSQLIKREYKWAAVYAVAAILLLLLFDFRSLSDALCAMAPVSIGFIGAFGVMGFANIPLNFANIIVLPVVFGIGVNAGVHVVHRWRAEPFGRPAGLSGATGRGITLTTLTTMIGFGSLLVAEHRGIRSLAVVMLAGLSITLLACYFVLPAILRLRTRRIA